MVANEWISSLVVLALFAAGSVCQAGGHQGFCPRLLDAGVYVGPAPESAADIALLKRLGVREIIDNRTMRRLASNREARWARDCGIVYRSWPISTRPCFPDCNLEKTIERMVKRPCGTIYVHCSLGRDRTGLIAALYRYRYLGWSPERAFCEMQRGEFNSRLIELDQYFWRSVSCSAASLVSE